MFGNHFYHERIKRSVALFGALFNNINIIRKNSSGGGVSQVKVPLAYAPKRKFIERLKAREQNDLEKAEVVAITLPRMSFEQVGINYDPARQLPKTNACIVAGTDRSNRGKIYTKTPYNIQFQLSIYSKSHDEALQIVEQIFPYFTPSYTLTIKPLDDYPNIKDDVPLVLNGVSFTDDYEGVEEQRRTIIYTLDFEMKIDFYGPQTTGKVIETAMVDIYDIDASLADSDQPWSEIIVTTNPSPVGPDSDYTFVTTINSVE